MQVVVDTNIFIKALFFKNEWCMQLLNYEARGTIQFVFNLPMLRELNYVIISQLIANGTSERSIIKASDKMQDIFWRSRRVDCKTFSRLCVEDNSDNKFIDCAIDGNISYIISEDGHLSSDLSEVIKETYKHTVEILSAYQFITRVLLTGKFISITT